MNLLPDWKRLVRKAWSIRLMFLAGLFSSVEILLPLFVEEMPRGIFAVLTLVSVTGAFVSRLVAQKGMQ